MDRVKTGIEGLDKALNGGIPYRNVVLVSGGAGTGKSTLCLQYLVNGAKLYGEKGLYISTEQSREELLKAAEGFGWDLEELERQKLLRIAYFDVVGTDHFLEKIYKQYTDFNPRRVVLDSLTTFTDSLLVSSARDDTAFSMVQVAETVSPIPKTEKIIAKTLLYQLMKKLRLFDATIILTSELLEESKGLSADEISEFICDGVIEMHYLGISGADSRTLRVRKMRYCNHNKSYIPYEMTSQKGIIVHEEESMDVLMK